jgi:hypothetical protein
VSKSYALVTLKVRGSSIVQSWHHKCYICPGMNLPPIQLAAYNWEPMYLQGRT